MVPYAEQHLLLSLLGRGGGPGVDPRRVDGGGFVDLCRNHRLAGIAYEAIARSNGSFAPAILDGLRDQARRTLVDNLILLRALKQTAAALSEEGCGFVLLKGASLLGFLYPEIQLRPMTDLDLLIREKDWPKVAETLSQRGYRTPPPESERYYRESWYHQVVETPAPGTTRIEFHWNLESVERSRIDPEELIRDAVPCEIEGATYLRLSDDHLLLHLAVHLAHHFAAPSLHWVEDLRRLLEEGSLDWSRIAGTARAWGIENCLAYSFSYLERVFPGTLPPEARRFRWSPARRLILGCLGSGDPMLPHRKLENHPLRHAVSMVLLDRWIDVARYVTVHSVARARRAWGGKA
jgi:hypothetical protein